MREHIGGTDANGDWSLTAMNVDPWKEPLTYTGLPARFGVIKIKSLRFGVNIMAAGTRVLTVHVPEGLRIRSMRLPCGSSARVAGP